jgi:hypothetical protein
MSAVLPVLRGPIVRAWPKFELKGGFARYTSLSEILTAEFRTDAHFAQYSNPQVARRLGKECLKAEYLSQIGGAVRVVAIVFDADTPGHGALTPEWIDAERLKIERLQVEHPGVFVYFTRHGYRPVALLPEPILIASAKDAQLWTTFYLRSCAYLKRAFDINVDPLGDWQHLFRAPLATRDEGGQPENLPTIGDPSDIGTWEPKITPADIEAAKLLGKKPPKEKPPRKTPESVDYHGIGVIGQLLSEDGLLGDEKEPGMRKIKCPLHNEHSKGEPYDDSCVYYEPTSFGHYLGTIECLHESHGHHLKTSKDWLECWSQSRIDSVKEREGLPAFRQQPETKHTEGAAAPIDWDELDDPNGPDGVPVDDIEDLEREAIQSESEPLSSGGPREEHEQRDYFAGEVERLEKSTLDSIGRRKAGIDKPVATPFREYNACLEGGYFAGLHTTVGGTGSHKTELACATCSQAIDDGTPVIYVSLELEKEQVFTRIVARRAGIPWSKIWLGRYADQELELIKAEAVKMRGKPFRVIEGNAGGWSSSNLHDIVKEARKSYPAGPLFIALDFLQLVGANLGERVELREKIGSTAYRGKQLAREFGASILLISSTARDKYSLLTSALKDAGLSTMHAPHGGTVKTILNPQVLVGLGKESGEIEFAADSVTVIAKWPTRLDNGDGLLVLAVPKLRYGRESWCVLVARGGTQLAEFPCQTIDELPEVVDKRGGKEPVSDDDLVTRVVQSVAKNPGRLKSANDIVKHTVGNGKKLYDAIKIARCDGLITVASDGSFTTGEKH